jgi:hypothetical protein
MKETSATYIFRFLLEAVGQFVKVCIRLDMMNDTVKLDHPAVMYCVV